MSTSAALLHQVSIRTLRATANTEQEIAADAIAHVARGWAVCPLSRRQAARIGNWEPRATTDPTASASADAWTAAPDNDGLPCGREGLVVVDLFCGRAIRPSRGHFRSLRTRPVACWVVRWGR